MRPKSFRTLSTRLALGFTFSSTSFSGNDAHRRGPWELRMRGRLTSDVPAMSESVVLP